MSKEDLLKYFELELDYLRNNAKEFSKKHPQIAKNLSIINGESLDPGVERLIESFAFMTSKIQKQLDNCNFQLYDELLKTFIPELSLPIPSCAIVKFDDTNIQKDSQKTVVFPKGTVLKFLNKEAVPCFFKTVYDVTILPISVSQVSCIEKTSKQEIEVNFSLSKENDFIEEVVVKPIRFYINSEYPKSFRIYDHLFEKSKEIVVKIQTKNKTETLSYSAKDLFNTAGFNKEDRLFLEKANIYTYQEILIEYFCFPQKFLFFDLNINEICSKYKGLTQIDLSIKFPEELLSDFKEKNMFELHSTPCVNLFSRNSCPMVFDPIKEHHRVVADKFKHNDIHIYAVESVHNISTNKSNEVTEILPVEQIGINNLELTRRQQCWKSKFEMKKEAIDNRPNTYISIISNSNDDLLNKSYLVAKSFCYNGDFPHNNMKISSSKFVIDSDSDINVLLLSHPTKSVDSHLNDKHKLRFLKSLSIKTDDTFNPSASSHSLKNVLSVYNLFNDNSEDIESISDLRERSVLLKKRDKRLGLYIKNATEISVYINKKKFVSKSFFLFINILKHVFKTTSNISNSFILKIYSEEEKLLHHFEY